MTTSVSASRSIDAPAERVFALVTDLPRMGDWSPENVGGEWAGGATGATVGARFNGRNRNGSKSWSTTCRVVEYEAPSRFVFEVTAGPFKVARWEYRIDPRAGGCTVTETWTDRRNGVISRLGGVFSGVSDRADFNRTSIETTLAALDATATA